MTASPKPRGGVVVPQPAYFGRRLGVRSFLFLPLVLGLSLVAIAVIQTTDSPVGTINFVTSEVGSTDGNIATVETSGPHRALGSHQSARREAIGNGDADNEEEVRRPARWSFPAGLPVRAAAPSGTRLSSRALNAAVL